TSSDRDWSSDVCSSDLPKKVRVSRNALQPERAAKFFHVIQDGLCPTGILQPILQSHPTYWFCGPSFDRLRGLVRVSEDDADNLRSEERRVGKECNTSL